MTYPDISFDETQLLVALGDASSKDDASMTWLIFCPDMLRVSTCAPEDTCESFAEALNTLRGKPSPACFSGRGLCPVAVTGFRSRAAHPQMTCDGWPEPQAICQAGLFSDRLWREGISGALSMCGTMFSVAAPRLPYAHRELPLW